MKPLPIILAGLLLCLSGCGAPPEPILRVGSSVWPGYEPLYLAREQGAFEGHAIHLVEMASSTSVTHALRMGNLEAAALTLDGAMRLAAEGLALRVVLITNLSAGGDGVVAAPHIQGPEALRGRRIGVETGAIGAIMLHTLLQHANLEPPDVELVYLSIDQTPHALQQGDVDAVISYEPYLSQARARGGQLILDSRAIPGTIIDVLVVREDRLATVERPLRALLAGYFQALEFLHNDPEAAVRAMQPRLGLDTEAALASFQGLELLDVEHNRRWLSGGNGAFQQGIDTLQNLLLTMGVIQAPIPRPPTPDPDWLPEP